MAKKPKVSVRLENLMSQVRAGKAICLTIRHSEVGDEREYWIEPGGSIRRCLGGPSRSRARSDSPRTRRAVSRHGQSNLSGGLR
jgi:hypothetical protein